MLAFTALALPAIAGTNLITNGSFEQNTPYNVPPKLNQTYDPPSHAVTGWGYEGDSPAGAGSVWGYTPTHGSYLSLIGGPVSSNAGRFTSEDSYFSLTAGQQYTLSFDSLGHVVYKADWTVGPWQPGKMNLEYKVVYKGGPLDGQVMAEGLVSPVKGTWTNTSVTFTPAQSGSAAVAVYRYNSGWTGDVARVYCAVDNFKLAADPNLINGSFEENTPYNVWPNADQTYNPPSHAVTGWGYTNDCPAGAGSVWGRTPTDGSYLSLIGGFVSSNAGRFTSADSYFVLTAGRKYTLSFDALGHVAYNSAWGVLPWEPGKMNLEYKVVYKGGPSNDQAMAEGLVSPVQGTWTKTSVTFTPAQSGFAALSVYRYNSGWAGNVNFTSHAVDNFKLAVVPPLKGTLIRFH
jgi:hypothetical protein